MCVRTNACSRMHVCVLVRYDQEYPLFLNAIYTCTVPNLANYLPAEFESVTPYVVFTIKRTTAARGVSAKTTKRYHIGTR